MEGAPPDIYRIFRVERVAAVVEKVTDKWTPLSLRVLETDRRANMATNMVRVWARRVVGYLKVLTASISTAFESKALESKDDLSR